jgi:hypothetical protein
MTFSRIAPVALAMGVLLTADSASNAASTDPLGHRLTLSLFEYSGSQGESKVYFSRFKGILKDKLEVLVEELPASGKRFDYLRALALEPQGESGLRDGLTTEASVQDYWSRSHSLLLFRGVLSADNSGPYFAQSRVYMGDLRGGFAQPSISVRLPISVDEYPTTSDTHSLMVYYTLAQDAIRLGDDPANILDLLSRAQDKVRDLRHRSQLPPPIEQLSKALESAIADQRTRVAK